MNTIKYEEQPLIIYKNSSGGIIVVCVSLMQEVLGSIPGWVKQMNLKLVLGLAALPPS